MEMHFDVITPFIVIIGIANVVLYMRAVSKTKNLDELVHPKSDRRIGMQANMTITDNDCEELIKSSNAAARSYTFFTNITAIFPLLGIFGTVISLMNASGADNLSVNFPMALRTTAAGLACAIIFKVLDATISSSLDRALDEADYLIHKHDEEKRNSHASQTETGYRH